MPDCQHIDWRIGLRKIGGDFCGSLKKTRLTGNWRIRWVLLVEVIYGRI